MEHVEHVGHAGRLQSSCHADRSLDLSEAYEKFKALLNEAKKLGWLLRRRSLVGRHPERMVGNF